MADFKTAFAWMMDNEDPHGLCAIIPDAPPGAHAISGINSAAFPSDFAAIAAIDQLNRAPSIQRFYQLHFWNRWFDQLDSDEVAKRVFDAAVNMGARTAVKLLQGAIGGSLPVDGTWGPNTVAAANSMASDALVIAFKAERVQHYADIVEANPGYEKYLREWTERASE